MRRPELANPPDLGAGRLDALQRHAFEYFPAMVDPDRKALSGAMNDTSSPVHIHFIPHGSDYLENGGGVASPPGTTTRDRSSPRDLFAAATLMGMIPMTFLFPHLGGAMTVEEEPMRLLNLLAVLGLAGLAWIGWRIHRNRRDQPDEPKEDHGPGAAPAPAVPLQQRSDHE
ncbi:MAG TPA: hypothetical protein VMM12_17500 [Longimicrobiales bacterium]|nr:hypothetical protein [Longimicrobiales bacterium]